MLVTAYELGRLLYMLPNPKTVLQDSYTIAVYPEEPMKAFTSPTAVEEVPDVIKVTFEKMIRDDEVVWGLTVP